MLVEVITITALRLSVVETLVLMMVVVVVVGLTRLLVEIIELVLRSTCLVMD